MKGKCPLCPPKSPNDRELIAGLCPVHYWDRLRKKSATPIKKKGLVRKPWPAKEGIILRSFDSSIKTLPEWYIYQFNQGVVKCENCGDIINQFSEHAIVSAQAHIIPKSLFRSVALHPFNILHLCNQYNHNNCHGRYDSSWAKAVLMPVFEIAKQRFSLFYHEIHQDELRKLPDSLKEIVQYA